jgi:pimeloyl-ACP methyl ester carboxylesterase
VSAAVEIGSVGVPGARLHVERAGTGPALLLIAGGGGDAGMFAAARAHLTDRFTVLTYDRRGNSRSPLTGPDAPIDFGTQADDAAAVLDHAGVDEACVFGSSGGALITLELLVRHPSRVRAAVVHEPPAVALLGRDSPEWRALADVHEVAVRRGPMHGFAAFGAMTLTDPPRVFRTPAGRSLVARGSRVAVAAGAALRTVTRREPGTMTRQLLNAGYMLRTEMPLALDWLPPLDRLADVPVPWCVAIGRDSAGRPYDRPGRVIAERAGVGCVGVPGGHTDYIDHPAGFAEALRDLLADLQAR